MLSNEDYTAAVNFSIDAMHQILSDKHNKILKECLIYAKKEPLRKLKKEIKELIKKINQSNNFIINIKKILKPYIYDEIIKTISWALNQYLIHCNIELSLIVLYSVRIMIENEQENINIILKNLYMFCEFVNNNKKKILESCPNKYMKDSIAKQLNFW